MKDKYFITGGSGFVGSNIVRALVRNGEHVALLVRNKMLNWRLSDLKDSLTIYDGDMLHTNFASVFAREKPTVVFHFAAYGVMPRESNLNDMVDVNVKGLSRMLSAARVTPIRLFVNTGSSSEYGVKEKKMKESDVLCPVNDYGVTKAVATLLCQKVARNSSFSLITLRLFSPYGFFEQPVRFIPSVIHAAMSGRPLLATSPSFVRDFIFIDDVVRAYLYAAKKSGSAVNGHIINIGSGRQHSLGDIVSGVEKITKQKIDVRWDAKSRQKRQIEPKRWEADITKAKQLLGWKPTVSLESGLKKTISWMKRAH
jgi:nucleoside-diphosphate-sugar epimerase